MLLYSNGNQEDKKLFIWDLTTGYIVANCQIYPIPTVAVSWGGKIKDNRGIVTEYYQFATSGNMTIVLWKLDPFKGELSYEIIPTGNFTREYISLAFSLNEEKFLYAGIKYNLVQSI